MRGSALSRTVLALLLGVLLGGVLQWGYDHDHVVVRDTAAWVGVVAAATCGCCG